MMGALAGILAKLPWRRPKIRVLDITGRPVTMEALLVPGTIAAATICHLQSAGTRECEEFVFWSGHVVDDRIGIIGRAFLPETTQERGYVTIEDDTQLLAMIDLVHAHDELVLCQVHTHPGDAFHSATDDHGAVTDEVGFLSVVVPAFGVDGLAPAEIYRRTTVGWEHQGRVGEGALIRIFGDVLRYENGAWRDE